MARLEPVRNIRVIDNMRPDNLIRQPGPASHHPCILQRRIVDNRAYVHAFLSGRSRPGLSSISVTGHHMMTKRSKESSVGKDGVSTVRSRWLPNHKKKKK